MTKNIEEKEIFQFGFENPENEKSININDLEEAYRRGYAHGYQTGITTQPENFDELSKRIRVWRYDLEIKTGAPGTRYENTKF